MLRTLTVAAIAASTLVVPALADGGIRTTYTRAYYTARNHFHADVGRNIRRHGLRPGVTAARRHYRKSLKVLRRMLNPPPASPRRSLGSGSSGGGAGGDLAVIRACESGGNYSTNTGNGYSGSYQFDDATWRAAGGSTQSAWQASPAEQDRVAAAWIASGHRDAWPNC